MTEIVAPDQLTSCQRPNEGFPIVLTWSDPSSSIEQIFVWVRERRPWIEEQLRTCGAVLFRNFGIDIGSFRSFAVELSSSMATFTEESSPRSAISQDVATSTNYPKEYPIQFHNEYSYSARWPAKLFFCCIKPASCGGNTPLADSRRVLAALRPSTVEAFRSRRVLYRRNFYPGIGVGWETAFGSSDRSAVERYCTQHKISCEWLSAGGLRTSQVEDAIISHPQTGEPIWFNHAFFFNVRSLEPKEVRESMLQEKSDELSTNSYFGDGGEISEDLIEEIRRAYQQSRAEFQWERGDVLLIDNMLMAHSRSTYSGDRRIAVLMADPCSREVIGLRTTD